MSISGQDMENDDISLWLTPLRAALILQLDTPPSPQRRAIGGFIQRKGFLQATLAQVFVGSQPALAARSVARDISRD